MLVMVVAPSPSPSPSPSLLAILVDEDGTAVQLRILELAYRARNLVQFLIQYDDASIGSAVG
jgi:hypothetical protein